MWFVTNMKNQLRCTHCASVSHQTHSPGLWSGSNIWGNASCSLNVAYFGIRQQLWRKSMALQPQMSWSDLGGVHQLPVATRPFVEHWLFQSFPLCASDMRSNTSLCTVQILVPPRQILWGSLIGVKDQVWWGDSANTLPAFLLSSRALAQKTRHFRSLSKRCTCASQTGTWHSHL